MREYAHILEPYKGMNTRYFCPKCQHEKKSFSMYIDSKTGSYINNLVGRCNRESSCGYHYTPKQYFQDTKTLQPTNYTYQYKTVAPVPLKTKPVSFIPVEVFNASLKAQETSHFVQFITNLFGIDIASQLVKNYCIGTSKHWNGATVFWQIDTQGKIRTGKIMLYSPTTGKRVKEPYDHIYWAHKALKQPEFELKQCLFGEHLLADVSKPVAIVESEKTAVIASVYLPQFIWVAVGSLTNLNADKCTILKGRNVVLYPDINCFEKWNSKAKELSHIATFVISDYLESIASDAERENGLDIADYLIRFDYKTFAQPETKATAQEYEYQIKHLEQLAHHVIPDLLLSKNELIESIQTKTQTDVETANNVFQLLFENKIISQIGNKFSHSSYLPFNY